MSATVLYHIKCTFRQCIDYIDISWRSAARGRQTRRGASICVNDNRQMALWFLHILR